MTESEYIKNNYPDDFIVIVNEFYPLPKGGKIDVETKEIASTFTTADGTKRKDVIKKYESVSIKFNQLLQKGYDEILNIVTQIENAKYGEPKYLFLKKQIVPLNVTPSTVKSFFKRVKI